MICFFFFQAEDGIRDLTVTGVQTCALPISLPVELRQLVDSQTFQTRILKGDAHLDKAPLRPGGRVLDLHAAGRELGTDPVGLPEVLGFAGFVARRDAVDRKSTRLNSSHSQISYAVFCLKKKQ